MRLSLCEIHGFRDYFPVRKLCACCQDMQKFLAKQAELYDGRDRPYEVSIMKFYLIIIFFLLLV